MARNFPSFSQAMAPWVEVRSASVEMPELFNCQFQTALAIRKGSHDPGASVDFLTVNNQIGPPMGADHNKVDEPLVVPFW